MDVDTSGSTVNFDARRAGANAGAQRVAALLFDDDGNLRVYGTTVHRCAQSEISVGGYAQIYASRACVQFPERIRGRIALYGERAGACPSAQRIASTTDIDCAAASLCSNAPRRLSNRDRSRTGCGAD